nr:response regulator [uncultured Desulfobulbus sp.]
MNILIVDDEMMLVKSIQIGLQNLGHQVITAHCAELALEYLCLNGKGQEIDLVVTDYFMPGMNGLEFLAILRKSFPHLPVLLMTAYAETTLVIEALRLRCDGFLEKPFSLQQLVTEIENMMQQHPPLKHTAPPSRGES